jgi:hypothetical protein
MAYRILFRRDTNSNWSANNPVLSSGEPGFAIDSNILKIGDGVTPWLGLPEISGGVTGPTGDVDWNSISSNVLPTTTASYNIGSLAKQWNSFYVAGSIYLGQSTVNIAGSGTNFIINGGTANQIVGGLNVTGETNIRPYNVYTALVSQSTTSNPVDTVMHSTFNSTFTWERSYAGRYVVTSDSEFVENKVFVTFSQNAALGVQSAPCHYNWQWNDENTLYIESLNSSGATADNLFTGTSVEIRVYN